MLKLLLLLLLAQIAVLASAAERVTVKQLEQILASAQGTPDAKLARQLSQMELTERLTPARFSHWEADLPGVESRRSLLVLADVSGFLDLPAAEIPTTATPTLAAQRQIIALAANYAKKTISKLPNFFATRNTIRFEDSLGNIQGLSPGPHQPLHPVGTSTDTVFYRDGREVVNSEAVVDKKSELAAHGLATAGVFGPILATVLVDTAHGTLAWSHWEQSPTGSVAVFRYAIPKKESHYEVELSGAFRQYPGYHGTITIDPVDGTILRLVIEADLKPNDPVARSGVLVEYGPVEIGGKTYICPVKSVSISLTPAPSGLTHFQSGFAESYDAPARTRLQTSVNDVVFEQYHVFRADVRVLTGREAEIARNTPAPKITSAIPPGPEGSPTPAGKPLETTPVANGALPPVVASIPAHLDTPPPAVPEVLAPKSVQQPELTATPRVVVSSSVGQSPIPTLHVSSRIVYVDIVVRDNRGQIVRGLTQDDFRVLEDGTRQKIDLFRAATHDSSPSPHNSAPGTPVPGGKIPDQSANPAPPGTVNMILFDMLNTSLADQSYARKQMLKYLGKLPSGHEIALFILSDRLHMIQSFTGNSELLAQAARLLLPKASALFQSGSEQMRNNDLLGALPGNMTAGGGESFAMHLAGELSRENFQHGQVRNSITNEAFHELAQATAAFPGRKNLIWLSESFPLGALSSLQSFQSAPGSAMLATDLSGDVTSRVVSGSRIAVYPISVLGLETGGVNAEMNGTTAAGGNGAALGGGGAVGSNIGTLDSESSGGLAAGQPGGQTGGPRLPDTLGQQAGARDALREQMEEIANQTGGEAFFGSNDLSGALRRSLEAGENYYSLAYASTNKNWNGKFRKIHIELARKGYSLSYRRGYFSLPESPAVSGDAQR